MWSHPSNLTIMVSQTGQGLPWYISSKYDRICLSRLGFIQFKGSMNKFRLLIAKY